MLKAAVACAGALYSVGIGNQLAEARMCAAKLFDEKVDLLAQLESWQHVAWHNLQCCYQLQTLVATPSATVSMPEDSAMAELVGEVKELKA